MRNAILRTGKSGFGSGVGRVGTEARDALGGEGLISLEELAVLARKNVVCHLHRLWGIREEQRNEAHS